MSIQSEPAPRFSHWRALSLRRDGVGNGAAPAVGILIFGALLLIDRLPRFFQGDSIAYLSTGMNGWIPPDRSWAYGFGSRWLVEATHSASSLPVVQAICLLGAILATARVFAGSPQGRMAGLAIVALTSLDPLNQAFARFWLSDTIASAAFIVFVAVAAASTMGLRARVAWPLLAASCLVSVFVRVAYAPIEVGMLLIASAAACLTPRRDREPGLRRKLLAFAILPMIATAALAVANAQVTSKPFHGTLFINRMSSVFTMGAFLPALRQEDFERAGVSMTKAEFDRLNLGLYDDRVRGVWGEGPQYVRFFMQQRLGIADVYDVRFQKVCAAVVRSALLHHPQTLVETYVHSLALYYDPWEWTAGFREQMGFGRPLPDWVAAYLTNVTGRAVSPDITDAHSFVPDALFWVMGLYPVLLLGGTIASGCVLLGNRQFGTRHMLASGLISTLLLAPMFSHAVIPRYVVASVSLAEILLVLLMLNPSPTRNPRDRVSPAVP